MKTPEFNNVLRRVALSFLLLAVQACGTAQKYPNISGESPTENGQAVLHLVANDHIGEAKGFRLLSVNGIDLGVPAGDQIRIPVGDVDLELEIEWSNEIVEQLTIKFDAEAQTTYKLVVYELLKPAIEPQVSPDYSPDSFGEGIAEVIGYSLAYTVMIGAGLYLIPTMPIWVPIVESRKDQRPFRNCCFVWVEKVDGEVKSGEAPPEHSDYSRLQLLKKRLEEGDDSRELKIELARLGYTEPVESLAKKGDRQASIDLYLMTGISEPLYKLAERGDAQAANYIYRSMGDIRLLKELEEQGNSRAKIEIAAIEREKQHAAQLADSDRRKYEQADDAVDAQYQLYYSIKGDERLFWLCRAADNGNPSARYRVAMLYEHGIEGVSRDEARAEMWYRLAAISGNVWGDPNADRLANDATEGESAERQILLRNWQPGQCEAEILMSRNTD